MLKKLTLKEIVLYSASIIIGLVGIVFTILGIVGAHIPVTSSLAKIQIGFSWRWIGLIILAVAVILALITLLVVAKKTDRITEREIRRKQRLSAMMSDIDNKEETVVINKDELSNNTNNK